MGRRIAVTSTIAIVLIALVFVYLFEFLFSKPPAVAAVIRGGVAHLTLQTVPSLRARAGSRLGQLPGQGPQRPVAAHDDLQGPRAHARRRHGLPVRQPTGLRNPFLAPGARHGRRRRDDQRQDATACSTRTLRRTHFTVPDLGDQRPLPGVADNAKNQCGVAPCPLSRRTTRSRSSFRAPGPGTYRWQCFVPCALRVPLRQRRADADDRLDGRRARGHMSDGRRRAPAAAPLNRGTASASSSIWAVATAIAVPLMIWVVGPHIPPVRHEPADARPARASTSRCRRSRCRC